MSHEMVSLTFRCFTIIGLGVLLLIITYEWIHLFRFSLTKMVYKKGISAGEFTMVKHQD